MSSEKHQALPKHLLFATDLSARCDRGSDRAVLLSMQWRSHLTVVHALEQSAPAISQSPQNLPSWRHFPDRRKMVAMKRVKEDLSGRDVPFDLVLEEADPLDLILRTISQLACDFVITGVARGETFGRWILGTTVERLVRRVKLPVLVVKARARSEYQKILVAVDFSDASRKALVTALGMFPGAHITLLHCYSSLPSAIVDSQTADNVSREMAVGELRDFLRAPDLPSEVSDLPALIEHGDIGTVLQAYATDKDLDLLVIGSQGRNAVAAVILGSTAELLLSSAPCDVLLVNGSKNVPS
jgi:nucleotide-binding universal stress UspA family protein